MMWEAGLGGNDPMMHAAQLMEALLRNVRFLSAIGLHTGRMTVADAEAIKNIPGIETAVPFLDVSNNFFGQKILVTGKNGKTSSSVQLQGTNEKFPKIRNWPVVNGAFFNDADVRSAARVIVLGKTVKA